MWDWNFVIKLLIFYFLVYADLMICKRLDKKRYECIFIRKKKIILFRCKFEIKRRCYWDNDTKQYVYLLDEWLGIKKHQHIPTAEVENMCKMVINKMTFNQVKQCYQSSISINTIYRLIKNQRILYEVDFNTNPRNYQNIYIDIDDTYRNFRFDNKKQKCKEKVLHFYQERKDDKFINEVGLDSKKSMLLTISKIFSILSTYYGDLKQFNIFVCGDGARYIKTIASALHAKNVFDLWHLLNKIDAIFNTKKLKEFNPRCEGLVEQRFIKPTLKETIIELVKNGEVVKAYKLFIAVIKIYHLDCYELNGLIYYLRMNKKSIEIWNDPNYLGAFTETHVQQFGKSYFGNVGRCYSLESFMNILKARCLVFFLK